MKRINSILSMLCAIILLSTHFTLRAQSPAPPQIDTPLTVTQDYFFNAPLMVPYSSSEVGIFNNAEVEIFSSTEVTLLPGFTASTDSGCGEFVAGIRDCPVISIDAQVQHVSCYGKPDGKIRLICSGGNEPYLFNWSPINKITQTLSGLIPGTYSVTVADQSGCTVTDTITILEPPPMAVQVNTTPSECNESSGSATVIPSGGAGNYKYFWEQDGYNLAERAELSAGLYEILVQDSNNCSVNAKASISDVDGPEASVEILTGVSCHGYNDASARIILPSSYGPEPVFPCGTPHDRLPAGTHPVIQQDSNGCVTVVDIIITEPDPLTVEFEIALPECGQANGSILAIPSGGTSPYSYDWDNALSDSLRSNLSSGVYALRVSDATGCSIEQKIFLPDTNSFSLDIIATDVKCNKSEDGSIEVTPMGGKSPYVFRWFAGQSEFGSSSQLAQDLSTGIYQVFVNDSDECKSHATISIEYPEDFDLKFNTIHPSSDSTTDGSVSIILGGGSPPYVFEWSGEPGMSRLSDLGVGTYQLRVTDQNNCSTEVSIELKSASALMQVVSPCLVGTHPTNYADFNTTNIEADCATRPIPCNPLPNLPELNIVTHFGAIPNDNLSDQQSFEWASKFIRDNYCQSGVKLIIPPGVYNVGRQDLRNTYLLGFNVMQFCRCDNITIEGLPDPVTGENPKIIFEDCMKYGTFDRTTGMRLLHNIYPPIGDVSHLIWAADPGYIISMQESDNFNILNLDLDGNIDNFSIGGYFATDKAGINLPNGGMLLHSCSNGVIQNISATHFGQDGLLIKSDIALQPNPDMNIRILNSKFNRNSRAGFHWNGGRSVFMSNSECNYNGFGPWGGTRERDGFEMEIDDDPSTPVTNNIGNGHFFRCKFNFNASVGIHCNSGYRHYDRRVEHFRFKECTIVSGDGPYASWINSRDVQFECCTFAGQVMDAYDAYGSNKALNLHTKFLSCTFNEEFYDPYTSSIKAFTLNPGDCAIGTIGEATRQIRIESAKARVWFNNCRFNAARYNNFGYLMGRDPLNATSIEKIEITNSIFYKERGDPRMPNIGNTPFPEYNRELIRLERVRITENNKIFTPHNDPYCDCDNITVTHNVRPTCWYADACSLSGTISTLRVPRANGNGYCDPGPPGNHCLNFWPDGYTDAHFSTTDPPQIPCLVSPYRNPPFTQATIGIFPPTSLLTGYILLPETAPCDLIPPAPPERKSSNRDESIASFSIYPVPALDVVNLVHAPVGENFYIYNMEGKIIHHERITNKSHQLNIVNFPPGVYYLKVGTENVTAKLVKIGN